MGTALDHDGLSACNRWPPRQQSHQGRQECIQASSCSLLHSMRI